MPRAVRTDIVQPDGRHVYLYGDFEPVPAGYRAPSMPNGVYQRRWNPLRRAGRIELKVGNRAGG